MFCLKLAGIFTLAFALPLVHPNRIPAYDVFFPSKTPHVDESCVPFSRNRYRLSTYDLKKYMCFCTDTDAETRLFYEEMAELIIKLKEENNPLLTQFSQTFAKILKDLRLEFIGQSRVIEYIKKKDTSKPSTYGSPISTFIIDHTKLPLDEFYVQYNVFLMFHVLAKYESDFEKLKDFQIRTLLTNGFEFLSCHGKYSYANGEFKNLSTVIKLINRRVMKLFHSLSRANILELN